MVDDDIHVERRAEFARGIQQANSDAQVQFQLEMAKEFGSGPIPAATRAREAKDGTLEATGRLLTLQLIGFKRDFNNMQVPERRRMTDNLVLAMFLTERTREIRDAALKLNNLGAYSAYAALRQQVSTSLTSSYYKLASKDATLVYLGIEPCLIAALQLCKLPPVPTREEMGAAYQKKLTEFLGKP